MKVTERHTLAVKPRLRLKTLESGLPLSTLVCPSRLRFFMLRLFDQSFELDQVERVGDSQAGEGRTVHQEKN